MIALAPLLAAAFLASLLWPKATGLGTSAAHRPAPEASTRARPTLVRELGAAVPTPTPVDAPSPKPVIDSAYLEKTEVCRGEQNFLNVEAHTENGTDQYLTYLVKDPDTGQLERGARLAFRQQHASHEPIQIVVQGLGADHTLEIPPPTVKDCDEPVQVQIEFARSFDAPDRVGFTAKLVTAAGSSAGSFAPYEYIWDFDDGTNITESSGQLEHSYENRPQLARVSSFVVSVTARERGGRSASGARSVTFSNFGFLASAFENKVDIQVGAKSDPRAGGAAERLWLYHGHDKPIRLTQVHMREVELDDTETGGREVERADYSPTQALGFSELGPHQSADVVGLAKLTPTRRGTVRFYDVEGRSDDGKLAHASFVLGSPRPPGDASTAPHVDLGSLEDETTIEAL